MTDIENDNARGDEPQALESAAKSGATDLIGLAQDELSSNRPANQPPAPAPYAATILTSPHGRATKLYRGDALAKPLDYDAGFAFTAESAPCESFAELVHVLAGLGHNEFLIRGEIAPTYAEGFAKGLAYPRRVIDRGAELPTFVEAPRRWIVLDFDETSTPFDPDDVSGSVAAWRATLPAELRAAESAFFLSASSHRSPTLRGKLVVSLAEPLDDSQARSYAAQVGADPSVCGAVQPNYFAAPIFEGCADPLAGRRAPLTFAGAPARLLRVQASASTNAQLTPPAPLSDNTPEPSPDAIAIAEAIGDRWLDGDRVVSNAWLHMAGWLLGKGWGKADVGALLALLDAREPDADKRREHRHILGNAAQLSGPGAAREWLGEDFQKVDALVNRTALDVDRLHALISAQGPGPGAKTYVTGTGATVAFSGWGAPLKPIDWVCRDLGIAPSERKVTIIAGDPGTGKGPLASYLAVHIALGRSLFGRLAVQRCNVGIIDCEGLRLTVRRVVSFARGLGIQPSELDDRIFALDASPNDLAPGCVSAWIAPWIAQNGIKVLIVDSYMSAMSGRDADPNSPEFASLARELATLDITIIVIAHSRKFGRNEAGAQPALGDIAGSFALGGMAQTAIVVWRPNVEEEGLVSIACARAPEARFKTFNLRWQGAGAEDEQSWTASYEGTTAEARAEDASAAEDHVYTRAANLIMGRLRHVNPSKESDLIKASLLKQGEAIKVLGDMHQAGLIQRGSKDGTHMLTPIARTLGQGLTVQYEKRTIAPLGLKTKERALDAWGHLEQPLSDRKLREALRLSGTAWEREAPRLEASGLVRLDGVGWVRTAPTREDAEAALRAAAAATNEDEPQEDTKEPLLVRLAAARGAAN